MKRFRIALVVATGVLCLALLSAHLAFGQSQWFVVGDGNYQLVKPTRHGIVAFAVPYNRDLIERERPQAGKPGLIVTLGTTPIIKTTRVSSTRLSHLPVEVEAGSSKVLTMTVADETVALIASAGDWVFADSSPNGSTMVWSNQSSSAIWASAVKTWSPRPVTDDTNKGAFLEKIRDAYPEGWFLAWAQNPKFLSDGHTIVFQSNRNTKSFVDGLSLWTVDLDGKNEHLLLDAATFAGGQGHLEFIGERGASLLVYEAKEGKVYLADRTCTALKPLLDNVIVVSKSPDCRYLVTVEKNSASAISFFQVDSGLKLKVDIPAPYVFNDHGVWSADSRRFAFYGYNCQNPDDTKLVIIEPSAQTDSVTQVVGSRG